MAGVGLEGDFETLATMIEGLEKLGSPDSIRDLMVQLAEEARTQIQLSFEGSKDPYDKPWKPVHRGGKPLMDTGRLVRSFTVHHTAKGFRVGTNVGYAATHQYGAKIKAKRPGHPLKFKVGARGRGGWRSKYDVTIPARPFLPESNNLGPRWIRGFTAVTERFLKDRMGK